MERITGIYLIKNLVNNKVYIGKAIDIKRRLKYHKTKLLKDYYDPIQHTNRHLFNAVKKYGIENFKPFIIEKFKEVNEQQLKERELYWIEYYKSYDRNFGYNLRLDSSTKMIVHEETKQILSEKYIGQNNPNYNNKWTDEQKKNMSIIAKERHKSGNYYTQEWKDKISKNSSERWKDEDKKEKMAKNVSKTKQKKYKFLQYSYNNEFIREWDSVEEIIQHNLNYKWQNIYAVCNGYKKSYMGFIWRKELKI